MKSEPKWLPIESNPQVFNQLSSKLGLKLQRYCFQELVSFEEWAQQMIGQPILGIIFLFEQSGVQVEHKKEQELSLDPEIIPKDLFFMKQFADEACGTIAMFHIFLNIIDRHPDIFEGQCPLKYFQQDCKQKNYIQRGKLFESCEQINQLHCQAVEEGQSSVSQNVEEHFISIIEFKGGLYELDGCKKCPVYHGQCQSHQLLVKGCQLVKQFVDRDPQNVNLCVIALGKSMMI